jgi:hypothetical protein
MRCLLCHQPRQINTVVKSVATPVILTTLADQELANDLMHLQTVFRQSVKLYAQVTLRERLQYVLHVSNAVRAVNERGC